MAYVSVDDLKSVFGEREIDKVSQIQVGTAWQVDPDYKKVSTAIDYACEVIDGYLSNRYPVPLVEAPQTIKSIAYDLARYRYRNSNEGDKGEDVVGNRYKAALKSLEAYRDGKAELMGVEPKQGTASSTGSRLVKRVPGNHSYVDGLKGFM